MINVDEQSQIKNKMDIYKMLNGITIDRTPHYFIRKENKFHDKQHKEKKDGGGVTVFLSN